MATKFFQSLKQCFDKLSFRKNKKLALAPIEEKTNQSKITKNVYAETVHKDSEHTQVVFVEVESFHNHEAHVADLSIPLKVKITNYTREGDDPNLKITHYPPSNRLH